MKSPAEGGPALPRPTATAGLLKAWKRAENTPDMPELDNLRGNNRRSLRVLVTLIHAMCDGRPGTRFFMGSVSTGELLGRPHKTIRNWRR